MPIAVARLRLRILPSVADAGQTAVALRADVVALLATDGMDQQWGVVLRHPTAGVAVDNEACPGLQDGQTTRHLSICVTPWRWTRRCVDAWAGEPQAWDGLPWGYGAV
jgi:hypothetical protein